MTKINLTQDQLNALEICGQLLEVGNFSLSGKELGIAAQAKAILAQIVQDAKNPSVEEAEVISSKATRTSR